MNKWSPNPYPDRGHRHRWKLTKRTAATEGFRDWFSQEWTAEQPAKLERECQDCGARQSATLTTAQESALVPGYEAVADVEWK